MAERLKDTFFTKKYLNTFADVIKQHYKKFDKKNFLDLVFSRDWDSKELKEKMRHTTIALHETLPRDYKKALDILKKAAPHITGFGAMVLPDYVEVYGMDDWDASIPALGCFTKYSSSEFAIRPFLARDPERIMAHMREWAEDAAENVRRFASEGCRPRLPWAMALPAFKKDPGLILPVLEKLKDDESEFVRRSVANNLNDISKDNPEVVLGICEQWYGNSPRTDWIVKHACRSLLKAGNIRALRLFGFSDPSNLVVNELKLEKKTVLIGNDLQFSFELSVHGQKESKVRLEYRIDFVKKNGKQSGKIFQISEKTYKPGTYSFSKKHSFANLSTRKHYEGIHAIAIIVNGVQMKNEDFTVSCYNSIASGPLRESIVHRQE
ncbi:MAG: DNA alkylation repair protein [bacterium]|nr:DNA alkylation repair protein [bacterium]